MTNEDDWNRARIYVETLASKVAQLEDEINKAKEKIESLQSLGDYMMIRLDHSPSCSYGYEIPQGNICNCGIFDIRDRWIKVKRI